MCVCVCVWMRSSGGQAVFVSSCSVVVASASIVVQSNGLTAFTFVSLHFPHLVPPCPTLSSASPAFPDPPNYPTSPPRRPRRLPRLPRPRVATSPGGRPARAPTPLRPTRAAIAAKTSRCLTQGRLRHSGRGRRGPPTVHRKPPTREICGRHPTLLARGRTRLVTRRITRWSHRWCRRTRCLQIRPRPPSTAAARVRNRSDLCSFHLNSC